MDMMLRPVMLTVTPVVPLDDLEGARAFVARVRASVAALVRRCGTGAYVVLECSVKDKPSRVGCSHAALPGDECPVCQGSGVLPRVHLHAHVVTALPRCRMRSSPEAREAFSAVASAALAAGCQPGRDYHLLGDLPGGGDLESAFEGLGVRADWLRLQPGQAPGAAVGRYLAKQVGRYLSKEGGDSGQATFRALSSLRLWLDAIGLKRSAWSVGVMRAPRAARAEAEDGAVLGAVVTEETVGVQEGFVPKASRWSSVDDLRRDSKRGEVPTYAVGVRANVPVVAASVPTGSLDLFHVIKCVSIWGRKAGSLPRVRLHTRAARRIWRRHFVAGLDLEGFRYPRQAWSYAGDGQVDPPVVGPYARWWRTVGAERRYMVGGSECACAPVSARLRSAARRGLLGVELSRLTTEERLLLPEFWRRALRAAEYAGKLEWGRAVEA